MGAGNSLLKAEEYYFQFKVKKNDFSAATLDLSDKSKNLMWGCDGNTLLLWGAILIVLICCAQTKKKMLENFHKWIWKINEKKSEIYYGFQNGRNIRVNLQMQEIASQITSDNKYSSFRI